MHILLVADGRSPITRRWIKAIQPLGYTISLISTFPCSSIEGVNLAAVLPVAFARFAGSQAGVATPASSKKSLVARFRPLLANLRHWLGPWTLPFYTRAYRQLVADLHPDLVHALRIPYEGMLANATPKNIPLVVSTWGNDLTLHAPAGPRMRSLTRRTLRRADALMSDTQRDVDLSQQWGFDSAKPSLVVVGNGGLDLEELKTAAAGIQHADPPQIINPRGMRSYVRNDTFFKAIPLVLAQHPEVQFVCASMAEQPEAVQWVTTLGIEKNVTLLPYLSQTDLWQEYARSLISVSVSTHDGTPNTLLEAMALGCLPICGDIPSIREWITPGVNGLLVSPDDSAALAKTILHGLENTGLRTKASDENKKRIEQRASITQTRTAIDQLLCNLKIQITI
jgi:glycosyltransferase involved in cell wall biosynthesis